MSSATTPLAYPTNALDRGLRLIQLVRDEGSIRVMEAADELGVSRSSAHRLLQALVYRDFLVQNEDHVYEQGPAISARPLEMAGLRDLRARAKPHMDRLVGKLGHASNLLINDGWHVRFLTCVTFPGGTYDRRGSLMAAHRTAGGRVMLAQLDDDTLSRRYASTSQQVHARTPALSHAEFDDLLVKVNRARRAGFSFSRGEVDRSVTAVATCVRDASGQPIAALTVSARTPDTIAGDDIARSADELFLARERIEADLVAG
ncbi:IclR family transcriptional regulator [Microbacterium album]|uniref:IclR family transcriptional regulator n=1 Tax=Microbacterium album TaxID=2053191 RepID=UPI001666F82B|nr:IclR family transcriptional regulator C-terminal domain-containing protein [Microbacterium album]